MRRKYILFLSISVITTILLYIFVSNHTTSDSKLLPTNPSEQINKVDKLTLAREKAPQACTSGKSENKSSIVPSQKKNKDYSHIDNELSLEDLPVDLDIMSPPGWQIHSYTHKDNYVATRMGTTSLKTLAHNRYDLLTEQGMEVALTDIYKLYDLRNDEYYQQNWPKDTLIPFIGVVLEEILDKQPDNCSAILLKSCVALEQGKHLDAINLYKDACTSIKQNNATVFLTELTKAACYLLSSDKLTQEDKNTVKSLTYDAGLPINAPLASFMEGKQVDVVLNRYVRENKDPFDISVSKQFFQGKVPEAIIGGRTTLNINSLSKKAQLEYFSYVLGALKTEKDARAILELANNIKNTNVPNTFALVAEFNAHLMTGRASASAELYEKIRKTEEYQQIPNLRSSLHYRMGRLYYEQGNYVKAQEVLSPVAENLRNLAYTKDQEDVAKLVSNISNVLEKGQGL